MSGARRSSSNRSVDIPIHAGSLKAILHVPERAVGVVVFSQGSGSGHGSPRNQFVAQRLQEAGFATLLVDLLTQEEFADPNSIFDVELLADRLLSALAWLGRQEETSRLSPSLFGASTGAAAALIAVARNPSAAIAVVSRGGRPDLAGQHLRFVQTPTLFIVGGDDEVVFDLNHHAFASLHCTKEMAVIPGASHLFEEPGAMEEVAELARTWFTRLYRGAIGHRTGLQEANRPREGASAR